MTKQILASFVLGISLLTACGAPVDTEGKEDYQVAWETAVFHAEKKNCKALKALMTDRVSPTKDDCNEIFNYVATQELTPQWDGIEWEERGEDAKIRVYNEATSKTLALIKKEKGKWKIDNVFWR